MGCFGIGVSRLLGAIADSTADDKGLVWPGSIAPFAACAIVLDAGYLEDFKSAVENLPCDILVDDRFGHSFGQRIKDAELVGYPRIIVVGRGWAKEKLLEIHDRKAGSRVEVRVNELESLLADVLDP